MFYPEYDLTDPYAAKSRGYYFHSQSYMQIPPHVSDPSFPLTLAAECSFSLWIRPKSPNGVLFEKQDDSRDTLISF